MTACSSDGILLIIIKQASKKLPTMVMAIMFTRNEYNMVVPFLLIGGSRIGRRSIVDWLNIIGTGIGGMIIRGGRSWNKGRIVESSGKPIVLFVTIRNGGCNKIVGWNCRCSRDSSTWRSVLRRCLIGSIGGGTILVIFRFGKLHRKG